MTYGCQVWRQGDIQLIKRINNLQNKAVPLIYFKSHDCQTSPIYKENKILKFKDHVHLSNNLFIFEYLTNNLPEAFDNTLTLTNSQHNYETRNATKHLLNLPQVNTTKYGLNSILYKSTKDWNELKSNNPNIQKIQSKCKLKNIITKLLLDTY